MNLGIESHGVGMAQPLLDFLIGEAMFIGLEASIREMRKLLDEARA